MKLKERIERIIDMSLDELNWAIAKIFGWTIRYNADEKPPMMTLIDPDGNRVAGTSLFVLKSDGELFDMLVNLAEYGAAYVPRYATNDSDSLELLAEICDSVEWGEHIYGVGKQPFTKKWIVARMGEPYAAYPSASTPAEAIARAYLIRKGLTNDN